MNPVFVHEDSYKGLKGLSHRSRLNTLLRILRKLDFPRTGKLGDFGCSNGFIIETLQAHQLPGPDWHFYGFDHHEDLLSNARLKTLRNVEFKTIDLNVAQDFDEQFDLVMCLETLEHVGSYTTALESLLRACKPGGLIVISVPREKGLPGLAKFAARLALYNNPYGNFFEGKSQIQYCMALLLGKRIDHFRTPPRSGWAPHLGFDNEVFESNLRDKFRQHHLELKLTNFFGFNVFYVFRKFHD